MVLVSTPILAEAARLLETNVLRDTIDIYTVGETVTVGINVTRSLTLVAEDIPSLVQDTLLANAVESRVTSVYSVKVARTRPIAPGMVVEVKTCSLQPELEGKRLLIDKASRNGANIIVKAIASDWEAVDQQGKEGL